MRYELTEIASACPVCEGSDGEVLHRVSAHEAAQHFVLREVAPDRHDRLAGVIRRLWDGDEAALVRCKACGFVHAEPHVSGDLEFYTLAYERTHYPKDKWEFSKSVEAITSDPRIADIGLENLRVLELGAGEGNFLRKLIAAGVKPENITATDYSDYGREQIASLGVTVHGKDVHDLTVQDLGGPVHVICLFQMLEHMDDPVRLFANSPNWVWVP